MALINKLSSIGDAIREKTGKTGLLTLDQMPAEIAGIETSGGSIEIEPIVLTGSLSYIGKGPLASKTIEVFGNKITTNNLKHINNMFEYCEVTNIPFELNMYNATYYYDCYNLFSHAEKLETPPIMNNFHPRSLSHMFYYCTNLRTMPENVFNNWDYNRINTYSSADISSMFDQCYSLRNIPESFLKNLYSASTDSSCNLFYYGFNSCYCLDEIRGITLNPNINMTSNMFYYTFNLCSRIKDIIFDCNEDGSSKTITAKNQTIDLSKSIGYASSSNKIMGYNSGIPDGKRVTDDITYQALKDDADWWTTNVAYSRYNHDSAVRTINSLPDTSAYLATAGGTNTIKFTGESGSSTDGGAINTLTEEEIAVATAKGWTVTLV